MDVRHYAIRRSVANTYLVRQRDRRLMRELLAVLLAVLLVGGGLLAYTWIHVETLRTGYRTTTLEKKLAELEENERRLRLSVSRLAHPATIEERAERELAMGQPTIAQTLFYRELVP